MNKTEANELRRLAAELTKAFYLGQERKSELSKEEVWETFNAFIDQILDSKEAVEKRTKRIPA